MILVRRAIPILLLMISLSLLATTDQPIFGQDPPPEVPHLAYGDSITLAEPSFVWLDVAQGDMFTFTVTGMPIQVEVRTNRNTTATVFNYDRSADSTAAVYQADEPGAYLWAFSGGGTVTATLAQGDTLSENRGQIALGETVIGTGVEWPSFHYYTIDLLPDTEVTVNIKGTCLQYNLRAFLFGLKPTPDHLPFAEMGRYHYVIPADRGGTHQLFVRCPSGEYQVSVVPGNEAWRDKGTLSINSEITNAGTAGLYDRYRLEIEQGDLVTAWIKTPPDVGFLMDAMAAPEGAGIRTGKYGVSALGYYTTLWAMGEGPYWLYIYTDQDYTVSMTSGAYLADDPTVTIGESVLVPEATDAWLVDIPEGTWVNLRMEPVDTDYVPEVELRDAADSMSPLGGPRSDSGAFVYTARLTGVPPYRLFSRSGGVPSYTLTVTEAEDPTIDRGEISIGQRIEGTAEAYQVLRYTLSETPPEGRFAVMTSGIDYLSVSAADGNAARRTYFSSLGSEADGEQIYLYIYELDGLCPCELRLPVRGPNYTVEVTLAPPEAIPALQPLNLGETVSGEMGTAWVVPYSLQATQYGDLVIHLEYDPTQNDANTVIVDAEFLTQDGPNYSGGNRSYAEIVKGYIVHRVPIDFPGEYIVSIKNVHGPYTLRVEQE